MTYLTKESVIMRNHAKSKVEALAIVAHHLSAQGLVVGDYKEALLAREAQATTYLGQGIAIPHGTLADKDKVAKTGVVLVHFADGVDWGNGNVVHLAVGIAAKSDEHLQILRQLARSLDNDKVANLLKTAKTADEVLGALGQQNSEFSSYVVQSSAQDIESLLVFANSFLSQKSAVSSGFLSDILSKPVIHLGNGLGFVQSKTAVLKPTALAISLDNAIGYRQHNISQFLLVANHDTADANFVSQMVDNVLKTPPTSREAWRSLFGHNNYHKDSVVLANQHGLHARPATALIEVAGQFEEDIQVSIDNDNFVSAKSLVRLLSLGATQGATLYFCTPNTDGASERLFAVVQAVESGLGEEVHVSTRAQQAVLPIAQEEELVLQKDERYCGMSASRGLCIAPAYVVKEYEFEFERTADNPSDQKNLLDQAIKNVRQELDGIIKNAKTREIAEIFTAHQHILDDGEILSGVHQRIDEGLSAPMAWHGEIEGLVQAQSRLDNPLLAQRAMDLKDIGQRVLASLCGVDIARPEGQYVLIKDDLLPSDVASLGENVSAIVTAFGGVNSHSAIIARALGIPALVGVGTVALQVAQGETLLVDAQEGYFVASPNEALVQTVLDKQAKLAYENNLAKLNAHEPATTTDGHQMEVVVNLGDVAGVQHAIELGAEGVGLLRTEFVFMKHNAMPNIDAQKADYMRVFEAMGSRPVVVRTLDVGGDKPLPYLTMNKEDNPFLGVRGVRLTLQRPDIFKDQLIALIQASNDVSKKTGVQQDLRIMFPMIGRLEEWRSARAILDEVLAVYPHPNLQVGMMIEVPSAVVLADKFAKEVDFFSIGTNDLVQYSLAIDRGHPSLSADADGLNPAILRLIEKTVQSAHAHGKWVGVCGELASDELAIPVLVGLGVDELSVSASQIPRVKMQIRKLTLSTCQDLAKTALELDTASDVRALVAKDSV